MKNIIFLLLIPFFGLAQFNPVFFYDRTAGVKSLNISLTSYYKFDSNANASVGGVNGSLLNSPTFTTGKVNNAINFGTDATVRIAYMADNNIFTFTDGVNDVPFSISFWVNTNTSANAQFIVNKRNQGGQYEWQMGINSTGTLFFSKFDTAQNLDRASMTTTSTFTFNTWHHVVITDASTSSSSGKIYVDGVLQSVTYSVSGSYTKMTNTTSDVVVGNYDSGAPDISRKLFGLVDELAIYKGRELKQSEVNYLYNGGNGRTYPF